MLTRPWPFRRPQGFSSCPTLPNGPFFLSAGSAYAPQKGEEEAHTLESGLPHTTFQSIAYPFFSRPKELQSKFDPKYDFIFVKKKRQNHLCWVEIWSELWAINATNLTLVGSPYLDIWGLIFPNTQVLNFHQLRGKVFHNTCAKPLPTHLILD